MKPPIHRVPPLSALCLILIGLWPLVGSPAAGAVEVTNLRVEQRPGTPLVDIRYDVTAATPTVSVSLYVHDRADPSADPVPVSSASGHIGASVPVGPDRHIEWDAVADWGPWGFTSAMEFTLQAQPMGSVLVLSGDLDFGEVTVGQTATRPLTIQNTGNSPLTVTGISYPDGFSGDWSGEVAPGGSQNVAVTFAPEAVQAYTGDLTVASDATAGNGTRSLAGQGMGAVIALSDDLAFGDLPFGDTATATFTIQNEGNLPLNVTGIEYPSGFSGDWSGLIPVGESQEVTVTFSPLAAQAYDGTVTVNSDAVLGTPILATSGTGTVTRILALSGALDFGEVPVGLNATRTLTIQNTGNSPLTVTGITYPETFSGAWSGEVAAGGSQSVTVTFAPEALQIYSGELTVGSDATAGVAATPVSGTGIEPTRIIVLFGDLDFGEVPVGQTATRTLTIQNTGNSPLTVTGIDSPEGFSGDWSGEVAPGGSQSVIVTFTPEALQTYGGELTVASDATAGDATRLLAGQGMGAVIALSDDLAFGDLPFGDTATATFTIHNQGNLPLNVSGIEYPSGFSGDWSGSIPVGQSRVITVTFSPLAAQAYGGTVTVNSDAVFGTPTLATSGTGTATRIINLLGDLDFGEVPVGQTATRMLTIQNTGNSPLTVTGINYPDGFSGDWSGEVAASSSRTVTVTFAPDDFKFYVADLSVSSDATSGHNSKQLKGVATSEDMILVRGGTLDMSMGTRSVNTFYIGRHEVTWGEWQEVMEWAGANGYDLGHDAHGCADDHPVHFVSWYDVVKWCNAKSEMEGLTPVYRIGGLIYRGGEPGYNDCYFDEDMFEDVCEFIETGFVEWDPDANGYRLPTEVEWEFAARGGNKSKGYLYSGSNDLDEVGWYMGNSDGSVCDFWGSSTWPVGQKKPNELGIYDMSGNVLEWCWDRFIPGLPYRIVKGGKWSTDAASCTVSSRFGVPPDYKMYFGAGFRVVRSTFDTSDAGTVTRILALGGDLDFGEVPVGQTATRTLTIQNIGNGPLTVTGITYPDGFSGDWSGRIAAGGSQSLTVTFAPGSAQSYIGDLTVASDATSGDAATTVSGTGFEFTRIIALSGDLDFGEVAVGQTATRTLTIQNTGNSPLTVTGITYPDGFSGDWSGEVAAGGSQSLIVTFTPEALQTYGGEITVASDATAGVAATPVSGTGIEPTRIIVLSGELDFGEVIIGQTAARALTIQNIGNSPLTVTGIGYPVGFSGDWSGEVAAGGSQSVTVTFAPEAVQAYGGELTVSSDATAGVAATAVSGTGIEPTRIIVLSGELDFGEVPVGQTATRTLVIENAGNSPLSVTGITYPEGFSGNWSGGTIPPGGSQVVTVMFAPTAEQAYGGELTVGSDATSGNHSIALSGRGISVPDGFVLVEGGTLSTRNDLDGTLVETFYIGRHEVTWGEWQEVRAWAEANGYEWKGPDGSSWGDYPSGCADDHPVHTVNWYDALKWSNAKSEMEGLTPVYTVDGELYRSGEPDHTTIAQDLSASGYRLPMEAEWEFAARGGNQTNGFTYAGSNDLDAVGWYRDNSGGAACNLASGRGTWPVGQKAPNELGLYDMSGNVWEWCWDQIGSNRHFRGGSWSHSAHNCTVSRRNYVSPVGRGYNGGFRLARSSGE